MKFASSSVGERPRLAGPLLTAFLASGVIMVVELSAGRLISRYLGMSLYTWTSTIAVVMAGMAVGNAVGGWIADRYPSKRALTILFALAALACFAILPVNGYLGAAPLLAHMAWPARIFAHCLALFFVPAMALGAITPVIARLALAQEGPTGRTVGLVYAASVAGSIFFTILTGYYLVSLLATSQIFLGASAALGALAIVYAAFALWSQDDEPNFDDDFADGFGGENPWWAAILTVFVSNFAFMAMELGAARIVSRDYGSSVYTWTSVIGIFLAGITLGNALGGMAADRGAEREKVAKYFLAAAIATFIAPMLFRLIFEVFVQDSKLEWTGWSTRIVLSLSISFFLPCVFVGFISPLIVERGLEDGRPQGRTVASVYAWGALGGVLGTLFTGYFLIDWIGAIAVVCLAGTLLAAAALAYGVNNPIYIVCGLIAAGIMVCAVATKGPPAAMGTALGVRPLIYDGTVYQDESQYSFIAVRAQKENPHIRALILDKLEHSNIDLDHQSTFKQEYEWVYDGVIETIFPAPKALRSLFIGGGGFVFPRYFEATRPGGHTEVAEIDPAVTKAAIEAFGLPRENTLDIHEMDARNRIETLVLQKNAAPDSVPPYDLIVGDSFNDYSVPAHLTTLEFTQEVASLLGEDGVYLLNVIDMYDPGQFIAAFLATLRQVFPHVYLFNCGAPPNVRDTFVVVCAQRELDLKAVAGAARYQYGFPGSLFTRAAIDALIERNGNRILTDDYAPTELLLLPVLLRPFEDPGQEHYQYAVEAMQKRDAPLALEECKLALAGHPDWPDALELSGEILIAEGHLPEGIESLTKAAKDSSDPARIHDKMGSALITAGLKDSGTTELETALKLDPDRVETLVKLSAIILESGKVDRAITLLEHAVAVDPKNVTAYFNLGFAHTANKEYAKAVEQWETALKIQPDHIDSLENLLLGYLTLKDYSNASKTVDRYKALGKEPPANLLQQLQAATGQKVTGPPAMLRPTAAP